MRTNRRPLQAGGGVLPGQTRFGYNSGKKQKAPKRPKAPKPPKGNGRRIVTTMADESAQQYGPLTVPTYSSEPAPMTADENAQYTESMLGIQNDYGTAANQVAAQQGQAAEQYQKALRAVAYDAATRREGAGKSLGAVGLGWSPAFMGAALLRSKEQQVADTAGNERSYADRKAALEAMLAQAAANRDTQLATLSRNRARMGADTARLIRGVN